MVVDVGGGGGGAAAAPRRWEMWDSSALGSRLALAQARLLKSVFYCGACGMRLWEDSKLLPAVSPTHPGCFWAVKMWEFGEFLQTADATFSPTDVGISVFLGSKYVIPPLISNSGSDDMKQQWKLHDAQWPWSCDTAPLMSPVFPVARLWFSHMSHLISQPPRKIWKMLAGRYINVLCWTTTMYTVALYFYHLVA